MTQASSDRAAAGPGERDVVRASTVEALFQDARAAVSDSDLEGAELLVKRLLQVLEAHFWLEDHVYFPAIRALLPDRAQGIESLAAEHAGILSALAAVRGVFAAGDRSQLERELQAVIALFAAHERHEEAILRNLEGPA